MIDRATGKGILIGLVSGTLLVYVVRPVFDNIPSAFLGVAGTLSNRIYSDAAQAAPTSDLILPALGVLLIFVVMAYLDRRFPKSPEKDSKVVRAVTAFLAGGFLGISASFFFIGIAAITSRSMERCFRARSAVLSPHLSDRESRELAAMWVLMGNRSDFDGVNRQIGEHARKYNITSVLKNLDEGNHQGRCLERR